MRYSQLARTAVQAVFGNGLRSALTMLGLVIGISSVIILVGIGDGTNRQVSEKMKALGGDALSAYLFDGDMGYNDLSGMNDLGAVDGVAPSKSLMKKLSVGTTVANKAFVEATDEHYLHVRVYCQALADKIGVMISTLSAFCVPTAFPTSEICQA